MKLKIDFNNCRPSEASPSADEARCICGSLVARVVVGGVELKCRRCRRIVLVPIDERAFGPSASRERAARSAPGTRP